MVRSTHPTKELMQSVSMNNQDFPTISVNGVVITQSDVGAELQHHPADQITDALNEATRALVVRQLMIQRAQAIGLLPETDPEGPQIAESKIEQAIADLIDREVELPEADEATCLHYFESNKEKFRSPPLVEASHILFTCDPKDVPKRQQQKIKADAVLEQLKQSPADFSRLVRQYSECPSKETDGNLGQITKGSTVAEFEKQVFNLPQGLGKYPIETRYGYHVVYINHRIEGQQLPYEAAKSKIAEYLNNQVYVRAVSQYISYLASEADIQGFDFDGADSPLVQ